MRQHRTVFAAFGTLFVVVLAGLGIRLADGHDPAIHSRAGVGVAAAAAQPPDDRAWPDGGARSDDGGSLATPAPRQAPPLRSGTS